MSRKRKDPPLTEVLRTRGYGHRSVLDLPPGQREIYRLDTGAVVAQLTAAAAWEWLRGDAKVDGQ